MSYASDIDDWGPVEKKPVEKPKETINGAEPAGVEPCPKCGSFILPDAKCESCGWNPNGTDCKQCGKRYDGDTCDECGWNTRTPQCRNCAAYLTDNHIVLKTLTDGWVWKTCAYCRWPIEKYLYTGLGQVEPWVEPYEYHYSSSHGTSPFGVVIVAVLGIFIFSALFGPLTDVSKGLIPANITQTSTNSTAIATGITPVIQLFPILFAALMMIIVVKTLGKGAF